MMTVDSCKPTVLVIEDEAGPRDALKVVLRPFFNIHAVESRLSALQVLREHPIDLITLDQKLPDCQGLDLLQEIKLECPNVEIIIITGYGSLKSAMEGIRHGAAGYLLKPFNVTELINLISQSLEKKQRLDQLREFLKISAGLWADEQEARRLWGELRAQYASLTKSEAPRDTRFGLYADWVPLLSDLQEAKDRQLFNHANRVSFYSTLLANPLHRSAPEQKSLALGAFLHDIGCIALDDRLVAQRGQLTDADLETFKRHPDLGARMILPLEFPAEAGQAISYHHERHDGSGYPYGLQRDGIPMVARVVSIAQTFDNLTTGRCGQQPISVDDAIKQIVSEAGTGFDPPLVDAFVSVVSTYKASLPAMVMPPSQAALQGIKEPPGAPLR